ncbi:MFS transporter [Nitrosococcus oceani]|uniref:Major facilitator superfamily MFS_1 n=2 Tax=Nitrosococcus oceani TaxID=1229 RepID=Q3JCC8_NITOC|nr:MFS transporter [Nitrosococcus oceani]KFI20018.1 MFS transporter [Nitrosococcus oceani C-27]ABA57518.1 Major facilitator superfamily MFS_1 [Nitrosococcus oceani ATCC 19707]EDZ66774.1 transporter, major facilitator family [Nitrosococcus oceani AFC27]KFI23190.1 MFS transporter [Nitrosococcus oceani]GEM20692.1 MFS transporter [Nitrosococcus oceani]
MTQSGHHSTPASKASLISWALYDWANSAFAAVITTFVFAAYFTRQVAENETLGSAQWGNIVGISGLVIAITGPLLGAIADQGGRRKPWIIVFTLLCVIATALLWFIKPTPDYAWLALLLVGLGTLGAEFAFIFYNAMLPGLAGPKYVGRWSGWGWSIGYAGGVACLIVALFAFIQGGNHWFGLDPDSAEPVRATFPLVSGWYLLFALPLFLITPDTQGTGKPLWRATKDGMRQLYDSIRHVRQYSTIARFLIARMFYIDGLATLFAFGGVYAAGTFDMDEQEILLFGIALNVTAGLGAAAFAWIDDWIGSKKTILLSLISLILLTTLILIVETSTLFWTFGLLLGIFVGPAQAASRSFLARVAPESLRNEMFGLFALSGKATAFLGPLLVGWITYLAGSQRIGMGAIVIFLLVGFVLMLTVPAAKKPEE